MINYNHITVDPMWSTATKYRSPSVSLLLLLASCDQMLSCLEHMYHDLDLVKDFNMNPITLKRWLVRLLEISTTFHHLLLRHLFHVY